MSPARAAYLVHRSNVHSVFCDIRWSVINNKCSVNANKKCSLKFSLLKNAKSGLGVWEPQKYFHIKSVHCLSNNGPQLFFEHPKLWRTKTLGCSKNSWGQMLKRQWTDLIWKYFWGSQTSSPNIAFSTS